MAKPNLLFRLRTLIMAFELGYSLMDPFSICSIGIVSCILHGVCWMDTMCFIDGLMLTPSRTHWFSFFPTPYVCLFVTNSKHFIYQISNDQRFPAGIIVLLSKATGRAKEKLSIGYMWITHSYTWLSKSSAILLRFAICKWEGAIVNLECCHSR